MRLPVVILLMAMAPAALAQAEDCTKAATQADLNACAAQSFSKSDTALNATYRQITARLKDDAAARSLLVAAERAWLAFRDAECAFASSGESGGSIYPMVVTNCRDELTQQRTKALQAYLACKEGDLSCPVPPP
jgi:uncharacterized protein YecT (DUF1311 family)